MITSRVDGPASLYHGTCRRYAPRYVPVFRDAFLAWCQEPTDLKPCADPDLDPDFDPQATLDFRVERDLETYSDYALLLDISLRGASVAIDRVPLLGQTVWFGLDHERAADWIEADVVSTTLSSTGPHVVRLSFRSDCSFVTIQTAICG